MSEENKPVRNPQYMWASRIAFWIVILVTLPLFFIDFNPDRPPANNVAIFLFHTYIALANYILGYRLHNPPAWAHFVMPQKWIAEWQYLVSADPVEIKQNRKGLIRVAGGAVLLTILLLASLSGNL